jgi:hypothetical protein
MSKHDYENAHRVTWCRIRTLGTTSDEVDGRFTTTHGMTKCRIQAPATTDYDEA